MKRATPPAQLFPAVQHSTGARGFRAIHRHLLAIGILAALPLASFAQAPEATEEAPQAQADEPASEAPETGEEEANGEAATETAAPSAEEPTEAEATSDETPAAATEEAPAAETTAEEAPAAETSAEESRAAEAASEPEASPEVDLQVSSDAVAQDAPSTETRTEEEDEDPPARFALHGEYRLRGNYMSNMALDTQERSGFEGELGQNLWLNQWLRIQAELQFTEHFRLVGQMDIADGVVAGDEAIGVGAARRPRDGSTAFEASGFDPRWLFAEWTSSIGQIRVGLQGSQWGLGLIANDGTQESPFGDYRYGNQSLRAMYLTRPRGPESPYFIAIAGDLVYEDPVARLTQGDRALQAVLSMGYLKDGKQLGGYVVRRRQHSPADRDADVSQADDELDLWIMDIFAKWDFPEPTGGRLRLAFEGVHIRGTTSLTRAYDRNEEDVRQWMWAAQIARTGDMFDATLEGGWTSGDSNPEDGVVRRATMHPDHRIGLILFPEMLAWHSARAASLARSEDLVGRAPPGSHLLPTDGGVSGAAYLFNHYALRPTPWLDLRLGWVWGMATSDVVSPYRQRAESRSRGWLGGDASNRGLGFEVDAAALVKLELPHDVNATFGIEGGVLLPGSAFDDTLGNRHSAIGMARIRAGLRF